MENAITSEAAEFSEALNELKSSGYTYTFLKKNEFLYCAEKELNFRSYELTITEKFRYENRNEPSMNSVLYAVESAEYGLRGFLIN